MEFSGCSDDDAFGPSIHGCRGDFDFTLRFEKLLLSILPCCVLIVMSVPRAMALVRRPEVVGGVLYRNIKLASMSLYAIFQLVLLALSCLGSAKLTTVFIASASLSSAAAVSMCALTFLEHARSPRPSILINSFLLVTILLDIAQTRSLWLSADSHNEVKYTLVFTIATAWKGVLILLESRQKGSWLLWEGKTHSPEVVSGLYGLGTLFWLNSLFLSGYTKILTLSDLFVLDDKMSAGSFRLVSPRHDKPGFGGKNGLARELGRTLAIPLLLPAMPRIALLGLGFCQPFLLQTLLNYLDEQEDANRGYGLIGATILVYTGIPLVNTFYWYLQERVLFMVRACLVAEVYRKTIQAKVTAADDSAAVTLMSTDIEQVRMAFMQLHEFWANPLQVAVACWLLQRQLGAAFVAPVVIVLICVACSTVLMRFIAPRQRAWMERIQKRVGHTANIIGNMKHLKISGLTAPVEEVIQKLRVDELNVGGKFRSFLVAAVAIAFTPILLAPVFTFATTSRSLDVTTIYTSVSYLLLLSEPLSALFQNIPQLLAGFACLRRIQSFLEQESRRDFRDDKKKVSTMAPARSDHRSVVNIIGGSFGWDEGKYHLKNINCSIPTGLTMVVGPVASGKSTLCKALLGETPSAQGRIIMNTGQIGYCDQSTFLSNLTIRENIIGFSAFDEKRYARVLEATMLTHDLSLLPQHDNTRIGSGGIALSGGQKQRVAMARALYLQSDLLIFDDVLSSLDADTERQVFKRVFGPTGLLKDRGATAILCTHSVQHLPEADHIIALSSDGTIVEEGFFDELVANHKYVHGLGVQARPDKSASSTQASASESDEIVETPIPRSKSLMTVSKPSAKEEDSTRSMGDISVFRHYFKSIGAFWMINFALFGLICGGFYSIPTLWLKYWSEDLSSPNPSRSSSFYLGLYALFQIIALGSLVTEAVLGLLVIIRISGADLHKAALQTVINAPLRFFAKTDTGVVTNLFSQDMTLIDTELPQALTNLSLQSWIAVGTAAVIATSSPYIAISYPFVAAILYGIQKFYLRTSRQLRLLDLEAKSPLYTNFLDTIKGVATIRAFHWTEDAIALNTQLLDTSQRPAYLLSMVQRWLAFVLGMVVSVIAILVVTLATQLHSNKGFTGASMVSIMSVGKTLANLIQMYTKLETSIGAVRRLKTFSETTAPESLPSETIIPAVSWPEKGRIEVQGISASYSESEDSEEQTARLALQDLALTIEPGRKVAICGRTGSGKSSIILLLLRLLDPKSRVSTMSIDGVSLHKIDRSTLRQRIIAVPQDPVFFPDGTSIQANLDPFDAATDGECQAALEVVGLWAFVCDRGGLASGITADSLSQGQKQLFSLARAILRRWIRRRAVAAELGEAYCDGGVLILDEVSSSVDAGTDSLVQDIIRREFEGYTILTVCHRLETIMDYDEALVLEAGRVVEQGAPRELVKKEEGRFKSLWMTGSM